MSRFRVFQFVVLTALAAVVVAGAASQEAGPIAYPDGYRKWTHVKSMVIHDPSHALFNAFGGIHHVYVNAKGAEAMRKGGTSYPDGTVFVFDLLEANLERGAYLEGKRKVLAVMVKDRARFAATGGWGWEAFAEGNPQERTVKDAAAECFACHKPQAKTDHVYSAWRP